MATTRVSLAVTVALSAGLTYALGREALSAAAAGSVRLAIEAAVFTAAVLFLVYGNLLYQWCRLGFYRRREWHLAAARDVLERIYDGPAPGLTVLIPSYKEEPRIVWQTLLSAAFTEYPNKSVVLLIDDPAHPADPEHARKLAQTRALPGRLNAMFGAAAGHFEAERDGLLAMGALDREAQTLHLVRLYVQASQWVELLAAEWLADAPQAGLDHSESFLVSSVVEALAAEHAAMADALRRRLEEGDLPDEAFLRRHFERLARIFRVRFTSFERKRYANLSHEANKAMNLNSYIGLMGGCWREVRTDEGLCLTRTAQVQDADLVVPQPEYVLTLDADSVLLPDYALRLVHVMEQPGHERLAIVQTPYSSFPGATSMLERLAGATTDLQYIVHQGFSQCGATFWVGANALIRRRALDDIKETRDERGHPVDIYIQDRTLIEDTESSIDLIQRGWGLLNYPERLAYSATPPDFGSLLIQRRRWANGGLIILPKLLRHVWRAPKTTLAAQEFLMRFHYLSSLAGATAAMVLVFFYPFDDRLSTAWLPLTSIPYFAMYARDLRIAGYRRSDVLRVYALNLALMPVIAGGVLKSLQQGITGARLPFGRTPKIASRSGVPPLYCALEIALPLMFVLTAAWDIYAQRWAHAAFSVLNAWLFGYALVVLLGLRETAGDLAAGLGVARATRATGTTTGDSGGAPDRADQGRAAAGEAAVSLD
jgi:cellulose synthase/poly-beta-1,6-N-acetylglucosamine synthase-like glycosyltransferase